MSEQEKMRTWGDPFGPPSAWTEDAAGYRQLIGDIGEVFCIVEIGAHFGYSTFTFAKHFPDAIVFAFDNFCMHDSNEARHHLNTHLPSFPNVKLFEMTSEEGAKMWADPSMFCHIDILHIDSAHSYESVKQDFSLWSPYLRTGGVVLFHDVTSYEDEIGKFYKEIGGDKIKGNLGVWYKS